MGIFHKSPTPAYSRAVCKPNAQIGESNLAAICLAAQGEVVGFAFEKSPAKTIAGLWIANVTTACGLKSVTGD